VTVKQHSKYTVLINTPLFPAFRSRLAALGRRSEPLRQANLAHLQEYFRACLPPWLLAGEDA